MSIFNHGDICRYICRYLSLEHICMFRRCSRQLRIFLSGKFLYDRKTAYLRNIGVMPSQIMGFTMDINYRRYLKKRGCRAICPSYRLIPICQLNIKLARHLMKTKPDELYGGHYARLMITKDHELIDLSVKLSRPHQLTHLFQEILNTDDDKLIKWFEDNYIGDQLKRLILEIRPVMEYQSAIGGPVEIMWRRYGDCLRSLFDPRPDLFTGKLLTNDIIFALSKGILPHRVDKCELNIDNRHLLLQFRQYGYIDKCDHFVKRD